MRPEKTAAPRLPPETALVYGKVTYFWSFIVALLLFSMGGLFSMYEGWHKLHAPEQLGSLVGRVQPAAFGSHDVDRVGLAGSAIRVEVGA